MKSSASALATMPMLVQMISASGGCERPVFSISANTFEQIDHVEEFEKFSTV